MSYLPLPLRLLLVLVITLVGLPIAFIMDLIRGLCHG